MDKRLPTDADEAATLRWLADKLHMSHAYAGGTVSGFVYFVSDGGLVKIGFSAAPAHRIKSIKGLKGAGPLELLGQARGTMAHERLFHALFWEQWIDGEWFEPNVAMCEAIKQAQAGMCAELILLDHVGRRRAPFKPPRFGPANRSQYDEEVIEYVHGSTSTFVHIRHPKGSLPAPIVSRTVKGRPPA